MGSTLILKVRICLKPLKHFFHQGGSAFVNIKPPVSSVVPPTARFLCTRDTDPHPETDRRRAEVRRRDGAVEERYKKPFELQSVFTAGTAKRVAEKMKKKTSVAHEEEKPARLANRTVDRLKPPDRPLSAAEWKELRESKGNPQRFDIRMISTLLSSKAELDIAKSLLNFVAMETGTLSYELLLRYLALCVNGGHYTEVFDMYNIMQASFPSLDTGAATLFIKSFSQTPRWREAIGMLHEVKKVFTPSARNYSDVITAAMLNGDMTTAWALYDELLESSLSPKQETWDALFNNVTRGKEEEGEAVEVMSHTEHQQRLLRILLYMRNNQIYPQKNLINSIKTWFESHPEQKWRGNWTKVSLKGVCRCCGRRLESIQLTADEYQQLKDRVMTDVIMGRDVFSKTTPEELERFKAFVKRKPAFDVVIDGLNVANAKRGKLWQSEMLLMMVLEFERQGLSVLVLGRKHMLNPTKNWNRHHMTLIQQKAHCFFIDNISEDDPFLLYASLHSGNHCQFVSRDLMRDHKACMPDSATRQLFFKWQRGHQLVMCNNIAEGQRVQFLSIPSYDTIVQTSGDSWHLPYDDTDNRSTYEVPQRWLCLTKMR